jgi:hypothetical protein
MTSEQELFKDVRRVWRVLKAERHIYKVDVQIPSTSRIILPIPHFIAARATVWKARQRQNIQKGFWSRVNVSMDTNEAFIGNKFPTGDFCHFWRLYLQVYEDYKVASCWSWTYQLTYLPKTKFALRPRFSVWSAAFCRGRCWTIMA